MKGWMIGLGVLGFLALVVLVVVVYVIGVANSETRLRNAIAAKQTDNTSEFDNCWKKISQVAQVTEGQKNALLEIFTGYAEARGKAMEGGAGVAKWVKESCPNVDTKTFENLQNIITGSRDRWTLQQKELIGLKNEHDNIRTQIPSSLICSILGRGEIKITVVTSTKTEEAFKTGKDDDTSVFQK